MMLKECFKINNEIYDENIINSCIGDFEEVSPITYSNGLLEITGESKEDILEVFREFMNYYIGIYNEQGLETN